jgi:hypothetical protein
MRPVYKLLEIDNHQKISDDIYNYLVNHTELLKFEKYCFFNHISPIHIVQHVPSLKEFLDNNCLKPTVTAVIVVPPGLENNLHADVDYPYVRVLWPIKHCQGSLTKMFDVPRECLKLHFQDEGVGGTFDPAQATSFFYQIVEQRDWPLIHEFELSQPVLIDVSVAHEVHPAPDATEHRISFTMGFDRDLAISKSINAWFGFQR